MLEIGELWAFENPVNGAYKSLLGYDPAALVRQQLIEAAIRGHDVQLQLHPQWIHAHWEISHWNLDYAHYQLTDFDDSEMVAILRRGKADLEDMLRPYCPDYRCSGFRAGHWNTQPSNRYLAALKGAELKSDTSVFKWGYAANPATTFDYRHAFSNVLAWYARADDINRPASEPTILEVPIATERVRYLRLITPHRMRCSLEIFREDREISAAVRKARHSNNRAGLLSEKLGQLFRHYPKKLDFCKLTAREILSSIERLMKQCQPLADCLPIPILMIGHSKDFDSATDLSRVLDTLARNFAGIVQFSTYSGFIRAYTATEQPYGLSVTPAIREPITRSL